MPAKNDKAIFVPIPEASPASHEDKNSLNIKAPNNKYTRENDKQIDIFGCKFIQNFEN